MDAAEWTWNRHDGMPAGGAPSKDRYFGFDADGAAYIMRYVENDGGNWVAMGFDTDGEPIFYIIRDENADIIKSHAACPLRWTELGLPPLGDLSPHDVARQAMRPIEDLGDKET